MCYHLWRSGEVPEDCQTPKVTPVFKKGKKHPWQCWPVSVVSIPGKGVKNLLLDPISFHLGDKKVIHQSAWIHYRSVMPEPPDCFCAGMTTWMDEGRAVSAVCFSFSKALTLPHILIHMLRKSGRWGGLRIGWIADPRGDQWHRLHWRPLTGGVPRVQYWGQCV